MVSFEIMWYDKLITLSLSATSSDFFHDLPLTFVYLLFVGSATDFPRPSMVGHSRGSCCSKACACWVFISRFWCWLLSGTHTISFPHLLCLYSNKFCNLNHFVAGTKLCCSVTVTCHEDRRRRLLDASSSFGKRISPWLLHNQLVWLPCWATCFQRFALPKVSSVCPSWFLIKLCLVILLFWSRKHITFFFCRIATRLDDMGFDVSLVATEWFLCLFSKSLPSEVLFFKKKTLHWILISLAL